MSIEDYFDIYGEPDDLEEPVTCWKCGRCDLAWNLIDGRWRLLTPSGRIHACGKINAAKEFEDLDK